MNVAWESQNLAPEIRWARERETGPPSCFVEGWAARVSHLGLKVGLAAAPPAVRHQVSFSASLSLPHLPTENGDVS